MVLRRWGGGGGGGLGGVETIIWFYQGNLAMPPLRHLTADVSSANLAGYLMRTNVRFTL